MTKQPKTLKHRYQLLLTDEQLADALKLKELGFNLQVVLRKELERLTATHLKQQA